MDPLTWFEAALNVADKAGAVAISPLDCVFRTLHNPGVALFLVYLAFVWFAYGRTLGGPRAFGSTFRVAYNVAQSLLSLAYTAALMYAVADRVQRVGWLGAACAKLDYAHNKNYQGADMWLYFLFGVNAAMRAVDFFDTVLIFDSGTLVSFLHTYHHAATFVLVCVQYADRTPFSWLTLLVNGGVHVVMYFYYALCSAGYRPPWKRFVTRLQIAQFVLILLAYGATTLGVALGLVECYATARAQWSALFVLSSYLVLFWRFERATYAARPKTE